MIALTNDQAIRVWGLIDLAPSALAACRMVREYIGQCDEEQITKMWTKLKAKED